MRKSNVTAWVIAIIVIILIIAGAWWYTHHGGQAQTAKSPAAASTAPVPPTTPAIQHPIANAASAPATASTAALPPLAKSDPAMKAALAQLGGASLGKRLANGHLVQRIVTTINALPQHAMGGDILPVFPPAGHFATRKVNGQLVIAPSDYARYAPYMRWVRQVDVSDLVAMYVHYYPLFEKAYRQLGYPNGYFNDRLVTVIDNLLKAPEPKGPVALKKTDTGYVFADPQLEALSVGQKLMIRVGPANEKVLKQKLRAIRAAVTGQKGPARTVSTQGPAMTVSPQGPAMPASTK